MTFTVIESYGLASRKYTLDVETLDDLFALGHDCYGGRKLMINFESMTITVLPICDEV